MKHAVALLLAVMAASATAVAHAQDPLTQNDFAIDVTTGPVLASGRIVGMGGAYTALAFGIDGAPWNPAAYATRTAWELDWFEWELLVGFLLPGSFSDLDFFNSGRDEGLVAKGFLFFDTGYRLQFGEVGLGISLRFQSFTVETPEGDVDVTLVVGNYGWARSFFEGQLVVGVGARTAGLTMSGAGGEIVDFDGTGPEAGVVVAPADQPFRVGLAARMPVESVQIGRRDTGTPVSEAGGFVLPERVYMPWEVQAGVTWQLGPRRLNNAWSDEGTPAQRVREALTVRRMDREREQLARELAKEGRSIDAGDPFRWLPRRAQDPGFWEAERARRQAEDEAFDDEVERREDALDAAYEARPRQYLLLSAELLLIGPTPRGVGFDGFLEQVRRRSGEAVSFGVRVGGEAEPWHNVLKIRAGSYLEPSRQTGSTLRLHGTAGFDVRLFRWDLFGLLAPFDLRAGATIDVAERYLDWGIGVGFWH